MTSKRLSSPASAVALGFFFAASAAAVPVTIHNNGFSTPITVDRTVDSGANWFLQDPGQFSFTLISGPAGLPSQFFTFCIEPREFISSNTTYTYDMTGLENGATNIGGMGTVHANFLRELLYLYYPDLSVAVSQPYAAALQMAIWEIVRETSGTFNLTAGSVQFRTPIVVPGFQTRQ